jgi:ribosome-associated protein
MDDLPVNERLTIPGSELRVSFARSGGPGGQNVNKVETKVELRWRPGESAAVGPAERPRLLQRLERRLTADGDLIITSSRTRDQGRNREDARAKLVTLVALALEKPKQRKRTRPSQQAVERRLRKKRERSEIKAARRMTDR